VRTKLGISKGNVKLMINVILKQLTAVKINGEMKAHHACSRLEQHQQSRTGEERMLPSTLSTASVEFGSMQICN